MADGKFYARWFATKRAASGLTYITLARKVSCSVSFLCDIENGRRLPNTTLTVRIAAAFGEEPIDSALLLASGTGHLDVPIEGLPASKVRAALEALYG